MSMKDTIAGLSYLSKQEVLMKLSVDIGKAEEAKRTFDLVLNLVGGLTVEGGPQPPAHLMDKARDTLKRVEDDLMLARSIVHHLTYVPEKVDA